MICHCLIVEIAAVLSLVVYQTGFVVADFGIAAVDFRSSDLAVGYFALIVKTAYRQIVCSLMIVADLGFAVTAGCYLGSVFYP